MMFVPLIMLSLTSLSLPRLLPNRFFNIIVSIADIYRNGAAGTLGKKVLYFYFLSTLMAVTNGCLISVAFSSLLSSKSNDDDDGGVGIELLCPKSYGKLSVLTSGIIQCLPNEDDENSSSNITRYNRFHLLDKEDLLINDAFPPRTFLDQMLSTFDSLVPSNVIQSFAVANIISIIIIGLVFGIAMTHLLNTHEEERRRTIALLKQGSGFRQGGSDLEESDERSMAPTPRPMNPGAVFDFCREMSLICNLIIQWIVKLAPYCIAFLIAGSLSQAGLSSPPSPLCPWSGLVWSDLL
jgi:Na+/H+-dicarboxylate symporter